MNSLSHALSWKQLIQKAEVCLEDGDYDETEQLYKEALSAVSDEVRSQSPACKQHTREASRLL